MKKRLRAVFTALTALIVALCVTACASTDDGVNDPPPKSNYTVSIAAVGSTTIKVTKTVTLRTSVTGTTQKDVTWSSLNENIATVSDRGVVTGVSAGTATIKATLVLDGNAYDTIKITVEPAVAPESIEITGQPDDLTGWVGETCKLTAAVTPQDANSSVTWTSSATDVASVAADGTVSFLAKGSATITAKSQADETKTDSVTFNVRKGVFITSKSSASWDMSNQDDETDPYIQITADNADDSKGFNAAYFAGYTGTKFFAEATFTVWSETSNTWDWQGFGLGAGLSDGDMRFFTFSPHSSKQTANNFNKVIVRDEPNSWGALTNRSQTWGGRGLDAISAGDPVKIGILRDGNDYYYFLNDVLFYFDYTTKYDGVNTYPAIITYDMPVKVTGARLVTETAQIDALLAGEECSKSFWPRNGVTYNSDSDFTFNTKSYAKDTEVHSIGDKAMVMRDFSIEFEVSNVDFGTGGQRFKGVTVNLSRYDTADSVETMGFGPSNQIAANNGAPVGRFFGWNYPDGMEGSALRNWSETAPVALDPEKQSYKVRLIRTIDENAQTSTFRLFIDGVELPFVVNNQGTQGATVNYIGAYLIWVAGEYTTFGVSDFIFDSAADASTFPPVATLTGNGELEIGDESTLACSLENATFASGNTAVATVDAAGKVTAVSAGTAVISAYVTVGEYTVVATKTITVAEAPTITITNERTELWPGETLEITYSLSAETAHGFSFTSSNAEIATVDENGVVSPVADGTVTITVRDKVNPAVFATVELTVFTSLRVQITNTQQYIETGTTMRVTHRFSFGANTVSYSSSNENIATVSADGIVTPVSTGKVTITVTCKEDNTVTASKEFDIVAPLSIEITNTETEMWLTGTLQVTTEFSYPAEHTITYSSSDTDKATVSDAGIITAVGLGEVTITVNVEAKNLTETITLTINDIVIDLSRDDGKWDYTDLPKANAQISTKGTGTVNYAEAAIKNVSGQKYYAEVTVNCTNPNGWVWNGITLGHNANGNTYGTRLSYSGDGGSVNKKLITMTTNPQTVDSFTEGGRTQVWNSQEIQAIDFTGVKLSVIRDGNAYYTFVNDKLVWYEDLYTDFNNIDTVPTITVRDMGVTVSAISTTTEASEVDIKLAAAEANKKYYTLYPNNVAIDNSTGTIEFKNNNDQWPFNNVKDNSAFSIGDKVRFEAGKDGKLELDVKFNECGENFMLAFTARNYNTPQEMRSFLMNKSVFGVNGWGWDGGMSAAINEQVAIPSAIDTNGTIHIKIERIKGSGFTMTVGDATKNWNYDVYDNAMIIWFAAVNCNAVMSNITVTSYDHPAA